MRKSLMAVAVLVAIPGLSTVAIAAGHDPLAQQCNVLNWRAGQQAACEAFVERRIDATQFKAACRRDALWADQPRVGSGVRAVKQHQRLVLCNKMAAQLTQRR